MFQTKCEMPEGLIGVAAIEAGGQALRDRLGKIASAAFTKMIEAIMVGKRNAAHVSEHAVHGIQDGAEEGEGKA